MTIRLLIAEDDKKFAALLRSFLERYDFVVEVAHDGEEGMELFLKNRFDVVLADGLMPKKDGLSLARDIRVTPKGNNVGIVMMTGVYKNAAWRRTAEQQANIDDVLDKPFELDELALLLKADARLS